MSKNRMEAFSDGVLAIIITIMVIKLTAPMGDRVRDINEILPTLVVYGLSYIYVGIYWVNHHHVVATLKKVELNVLWANLNWMFWMSLIPIANEWIGFHPMNRGPAVFYGLVLFLCSVAFNMLQGAIHKANSMNEWISYAIGRDFKGEVSILAYAVAIAAALIFPLVSYVIYFAVAIWWVIPDKKFRAEHERIIQATCDEEGNEDMNDE